MSSLRPFEVFQLDGLEWGQVIPKTTDSGRHRVEITWALDRYRVTVFEAATTSLAFYVVRRVHPRHAHTAIKTANSLFRKFNRREF